MIRAARRTFANEPAKQDAKVNAEFTRSSPGSANRWRSSLRSTPNKERNGAVPKQSFRGSTGKENFANMNRNPQNGTKAATTGVADVQDGRKSAKKDDIADKAKRKFMENLSKFQRESKQVEAAKSSPFQRSYRKGNGMNENAANAYRASYRPPPVTRPDTLSTGVRRSLRKDRANESSERNVNSTKHSKLKVSPVAGERSPKAKGSQQVEESDRSSTTSSARATAGSLSSRPSSASSTSTSVSDSSSRAPPTLQRKLSRAELAMERHMERMRKASSSSGGSTFGASSAPNAGTPKPKPRQTTDPDALEDIGATKLMFAKDNLYSPTQTLQKPFPGAVRDKSLDQIDEGLKSLGFGDEWLDSLNLAEFDVQQKSPISNVNTEPRQTPRKTPIGSKSSLNSLTSPSNEWPSVQIIEDYVFVPPTSKSDHRTSNQTETVHDSPHQTRAVNKGTSRDKSEPITACKQLPRTAEHASRDDDDAEISCSVEEAIDTFRKLSEEIDTLKNRDFGKKSKTKTEKKDQAKVSKPPTKKSNSPAVNKESRTIPVSPPSVRISEPRTLSGPPAPPVGAGSSPTGSTSQTRATREKQTAPEKREMTSHPVVARLVEGVSGAPSLDRHFNVAAHNDVATVVRAPTVAVKLDTRPLEKPSVADVNSAVKSVGKGSEIVSERHIINVTQSHVEKQVEIKVEQPKEKMSAKTQQRPGRLQQGKLSGLTAAEKRERLRRAVLKYQAEESSSDDESVFSDASSSGDEDESSWLDTTDTDASTSSFGKGRQKKVTSPRKTTTQAPVRAKTTQHNGDASRDHKPVSRDIEIASHDSGSDPVGTPDASRMKSMWETKMKESKVPVTSTPLSDVTMERTQPSVSDAKSAFESPATTVTSSPTRSENGDSESGKKLGSMLSMWENKKGAKAAAYDASTDEAFDSNTMGRLQGAKALFHNMSKKSPTKEKSRPSPANNEESPRPNTVSGAKSVFEAKATPKQTTVTKQQTSKPEPKVTTRGRQATISDESDFDDEDLSDAPTLSSTSSSEDEMESSSDKVGSVRRMWENQSIKKKAATTKIDEKQETKQAWESSGADQSEIIKEEPAQEEEKMPLNDKPLPLPKKAATKSNIQRKISAKKKGDRRSMTQPITGDDVNAAKELVNEQRTQQAAAEPSEREVDSPEEEKVPSFAERLAYFNKVCSRNPPSPVKKTKRSSLKRYNTQPVDLELVLEARKKLQGEEVTDSVDSAPPPSVQIEVPRDRVRKISETLESKQEESQTPPKPTRLSLTSTNDSSERSGDESDGHKAGKIKSKFLNKLPSPEPTRRRSPVRGKLPSIGSRSSGSIRDRSPSPLSFRSSSPQPSEEDPASEDMGKTREAEIKSTGSIRDRMKLLQKNQEEDWKKKVMKDEKKGGIKSSLSDRMNKLQESEEGWKKQKENPIVNGGRSSAVGASNITDRLNSIMVNSEGWKSRKGKQNDASQFTVQSKIKRSNPNVVPILPSPSLKRRVLPVPAKVDPVITIDDVTSGEPSLNKLSDVLRIARKGLEPEVVKTVEESTTEIPDLVNEDFEIFYSSSSIQIEEEMRVTENGVENGSADSDGEQPDMMSWLVDEEHHVEYLSQLGHLKRSVQRGSRNRGSTRNPLKALAAREDIKQSYTQQRSNITKLEQQRLATIHGHGANFTSAALAGLAHRADFSKVSLRSTKTTSAFSASDYKPWKNKMLLRVKGRRRVQTRLVEPCAASLNSGDAFLLILPDKMFGWYGEFSNVIERAKVAEISDYIIHQGDMGSKASSLNVIDETASSKIGSREFWQLIGGKGEYDPSGGDEEDETYEINTEAAIKTYKMVDAKLVPVQEAWGKLPTMGMLETTGTYVFDFGAEMYTWQGKEVSFDDRQLAVKLAKALWDQGYDYTDIGFCPFAPLSQLSTSLQGPRPEWGLFARVNENLETALMQEKFEDWSNIQREVGEREKVLKETSRGEVTSEMVTKTNIRPEMTKCDVKMMVEMKTKPLPVVLEGFNLWRGYGEMYDEDGRGLEVVSSSVFCWKATDKNIEQIDENDFGVFHRGDTYVVRWRYAVSSTGKWSAAEGEKNEGKKEPIGRERTAYFLWAGRDSTVNEKGASALMATEIDKEMGSQVIVTEGKEPPAMTQCFKGSMVAVDGKQGQRSGYYSWKLFAVRGNSTDEASLHQVPCECQSLRSRSSLVALNARQAKVVVWHGCASSEHSRNIAETAATKIQENKRACLGFRSSCKSVDLSVCEEGSETEDFTEALLRIRRNKYVSLLEVEVPKISHPRAWNLLPSGDQFVAQELPPVAKAMADFSEPYPLVYEQLQDPTRPAFVIVDGFDGVFLWMSLIPDDVKGSAKRQLDITKRLAMETAIDFCKEHRPDCDAILIHENHEPLPFTNSFPYWRVSDDKISIEQRRVNKPVPVKDILKTVSRLTYSLEELRATDNLPEGVDPNHLETYLSVKDFAELFDMDKEEFYKLPSWKQQNLRKEKNLF